MSKWKAKPMLNKKGTYHVEVNTGGEKILVGKTEGSYFIEYSEWDTEEEAIEWIESKDKLELNI